MLVTILYVNAVGLHGPYDLREVSPPRIDGLRSDPENLVADAAKTSFACHLFLKAIYDIFGTHLH